MLLMSVRTLLLGPALALLLPGPAGAQAVAPFTLKDGDRVVLLGSALVEHEQFHGYLETRLTSRFPEATVTFRNLGWSGDTVRGTARTSGFQNPDGFARLLKEVRAQKPTVVFVGYGTNESFAGPAGLPGFVQGMETLLDQLAPLKARVVLLSPTFHEDLGRPFPDPAEHNRSLEQYTDALEALAGRRKLRFVNLFHPLLKIKAADPRRQTTNGLLPNQYGYWLIAREVERQLYSAPRTWAVELDRSGKLLGSVRAAVTGIKAGPDGLRFDVRPAVLPAPPSPTGVPEVPRPSWRVTGLPPGRHALRVNGREEKQVRAGQWSGYGIRLWPADALRQTEKLRAAVVKKSETFYRRWRPFNDHERHWEYIGGDFKLYDDDVAREEAVIAGLRRPAALHCEIVPVKGAE
jgi:lysophospholipase L1-like esterase